MGNICNPTRRKDQTTKHIHTVTPPLADPELDLITKEDTLFLQEFQAFLEKEKLDPKKQCSGLNL